MNMLQKKSNFGKLGLGDQSDLGNQPLSATTGVERR